MISKLHAYSEKRRIFFALLLPIILLVFFYCLKTTTGYLSEVVTLHYYGQESGNIIIRQVIIHTFLIVLTLKLINKPFRPTNLRWPSARIVLFGYISLFFFIPISAFIAALLFSPDNTLAGLTELSKHPTRAFIAAVIIAPLTEEIFCRRILQEYLHDQLPDGIAIAIGTVFFALLHSEPYHATCTLGFSFVVSYIYFRTRNVLNTIAIHAIANGVTWYFTLSSQAVPIKKEAVGHREFSYQIITFLLLTALTYFGWRILKWSLRFKNPKKVPISDLTTSSV